MSYPVPVILEGREKQRRKHEVECPEEAFRLEMSSKIGTSGEFVREAVREELDIEDFDPIRRSKIRDSKLRRSSFEQEELDTIHFVPKIQGSAPYQ